MEINHDDNQRREAMKLLQELQAQGHMYQLPKGFELFQ